MLIDNLNKVELRNLLIKNWMTHDGAWFLNIYLRFGMRKANRLNKKAIKTLAPFEINRVKKLSGIGNKKLTDFKEVKTFINEAMSVLKGDFMAFHISFPEKNVIHWDMEKCFAYEGMKKLGVEKEYECGVIYRVSCWLDELGVEHTIKPKIKKCVLNNKKTCSGDINIYF